MEIEIDFSKSRLSDWRLIANVSKGIKPDDLPEWIEFLERVVVGGTERLPMTALRQVIEAVSKALTEQSNPKAPAA